MNSEDDKDELMPLLLLLWSKKFIICCLALVGLCIGVLVGLSKTSMYSADALVQLESKNGGITLSQDIAELMSNESEAIAEIEIVRSRMVVGKVVETLGLDLVKRPKMLPGIGDLFNKLGLERPAWLGSYAWGDETLEIGEFQVPAKLLGERIVFTAGADGAFTLEFIDGQVVNGQLGQTVEHFDLGYKIVVSEFTAAPGVQFSLTKLGERQAINVVRNALRVSEKGRNSNLLQVTTQHRDKQVAREILAGVLDTYVAQNIGRSSEEAEKSLEFLRTQIPIVQEDLVRAETQLNDYRLQHESINLDLESAAVLDRLVALDAQISGLELEETELARLYTRDHPRYAALVAKKQKLTNEKELLSSTVQSFPETQQEILRRTRDVEVNQQIYLQLLNKKQELNVLKASAVGSVRIIDAAMANPTPVSPNKQMLALMGAFLGLFSGCGAVLLRFFLLRNVDSPEDISKLGLPVYATVPLSVSQEKLKNPAGFVLSRDNPAELAVEALRSLRTSLHFGVLEEGKGVVSITGPAPALGKTFVTCNLAYLAAESGAKVLLVDADMRRGTVGKVFNVPAGSAGFSELLAGSASIEEVIHPVALSAGAQEQSNVLKTSSKVATREPELEAVLEGIKLLDYPAVDDASDSGSQGSGSLTVISRGAAPPNPSELLMQSSFAGFLKEMTECFDLVLFDTPPVLAATDSMIIGKHSDMNLMVVRHTETALHEVNEVVRSFKINNVDLSGVVLNGYNAKEGKFGQYGYTYGYQYAYESD